MQLLIRQATLPGTDGIWDVAIQSGRIVRLEPSGKEWVSASLNPVILEAKGQLLIPGFVDPHMHLDKSLLLDRCQAEEATFQEALQQTLHAKKRFTVADIRARAERAIQNSLRFGTTMRSHVEVDPVVQLKGMEALVPLREQVAWGMTLQLAVFALEGITQHPTQVDCLRQALDMGGDVIGSAPYVDPNPAQNIRIIFDLAQEFDRDVDFHLDFLDDQTPLSLPLVIDETLKRGWQGRVCLGHMTKLAGLDPETLRKLAERILEAGISILALPASDVYIMARRDSHNVRRGVLQSISWLGGESTPG